MFIRKLETILDLTVDELAAVRALPSYGLSLKRGHDIVRQGDTPSKCCMLLEGMACWNKVDSNGARQIMALHVPGDVPDVQSMFLDVMDATLTTLSPCEMVFIPLEAMRRLCFDYPRIGATLWRISLADAAIFREWVVNLGNREALGRISHLMMETFLKLNRVGLADGDTISFPLTQQDLADCVGLSTVHVNRSVQELRQRKAIQWTGSTLRILDREALEDIAGFDDTYLHLVRPRQPEHWLTPIDK